MKDHFVAMARYNAWANARLYGDTAGLPDEAISRDVGVYFGSLFATLVHIMRVDRAWLHLLDGGAIADLPPMPATSDVAELRHARESEDARLIQYIESLDPASFDTPFEFRSTLGSWQGLTYRGTRASIFTHLFNHQTHHRGQAHTALSLLGVEPSALDILVKGMLGE